MCSNQPFLVINHERKSKKKNEATLTEGQWYRNYVFNFEQGKAKQAEVVILQKRRAAMEKELKAMQGRKM